MTASTIGHRQLIAGAAPSIAQERGLDPRIFAATPNMAIEIGFDQHLFDSRADSALRQGAGKALEEFDAYADTFPLGSSERLYLTQLRMAAASIASGITRRKKILNNRLLAAEEEQRLFLRSFTRGQRLSGFLTGAMKLLLRFGFAYALARTVLGSVIQLPEAEAGAPRIDPQHASLAMALAFTILGSYFRELWLGWKLERARKRYRKEISQANEWYRDEVTKEYKLAAETANIAWLQLTGMQPPMTRSFESLLAGVLTTCVEEPVAEEEVGEPAGEV